MNRNKLKALAKNLQIKIKAEEFGFFLRSFENIDLMLLDLSKLEISEKIEPMERIIDSYLTLEELEKVRRDYQVTILSKEDIKKNASTGRDGLIFTRR